MARESVVQWAPEQGIDQFSDARHVEPIALLDAKNARFRKKGRLGKRYGTELLLQEPGSEAAAGRIYAVQDQVVVGDGTYLYSYTPDATGSLTSQKMPPVGTLPRALVTREGVWSATSPTLGDIAVGTNTYCVAWISSSGGLYFEVFDTVTGAPFGYAQTVLLSGVSFVRCAYLATAAKFYVVVSYAATTNIDALLVPVTGGAATTTTVNLTAGHKAASSFGLLATAANQLVLVYQNGVNYTPTTEVFTSAGVSAAGPTAITEAFAAKKADLFIDGSSADNVYVTYAVTNAGTNYVRYGASNATTAALVLAATTVVSSGTVSYSKPVVYRTNTGAAVLGYAAADTTGNWTDFATGTILGAVTALTNATVYWASPASGFFSRAVGYYDIWLTCGGAVQPTVYSSGTQRAAVPAVAPTLQYTRALVTLSTASTGSVNRMPHGVSDTRTAALQTGPVPNVVTTVVPQGAGSTYATVGLSNRDGFTLKDVAVHSADFGSRVRWQGATLGKHLLLSGGTPTVYDGTRLREAGFVYECQGPWVRTINAGAGAFPADTYFWCFVFRRTDRTGQVHRGVPSTPMDTLCVANDRISFTIPTLSMTPEPFNGTCEIEVYRTRGLTATGDTTLYLLDTIQNVTFAPTVSYVDSYAITDAVLATRPTLYTTGLAVENVLPPSAVTVFTHKQRAFFCERDRIWFSKLYVDGEFPGFADQFTIDIPGGNIVAAASLDDFALLFERTKIWRLTGEGPNDQGNGNDYQVTRVPTELGCIDPGSVITWAGGCFFRSGGGLYNINRGLGIEYLGRFVEDELTSATTITSAVVHPTEHTILFTLAGGTAGRRLVFDYMHGQWLKDEFAEGVGDQYGQAVSGSSLYHINSYGGLRRETPASFLDTSAWVTMTLKWGAVKLSGGVLGFQKILGFEFQAERKSAHGVTAKIYNEFSTTPEASQVWTEAQVSAFVGLPLYSDSVANSHPQGAATSLELSDTAPAVLGTGEGFTIMGVAAEGFVEAGTGRNPGANKR